MIAETGRFALILALLMAVIQAFVPLVGVWKRKLPLMVVGRHAALGQMTFMLIAYLCLTLTFVYSDFSVKLVASHSHTDTPLIYKITGVWGNHEGSMLLWALSLSLWTAAITFFSRHLPEPFLARVLAVMGWINTGFVAFILFTSDPFARLLPPPLEGHDLNPMLQDPGLIIHPPLLYMGYVGFSVAFSFAIAALMMGRMDAAWARWSRPWTIAAWIFLTAGIMVGSGWAYYELGWGGWWFWDPVENASFMPWLLGTALIHSLAVTEKRGAFRQWTILLAIGTFSLSLLGTFIVRSGVMTSVHAFASDPARGTFILVLLVLVIGISLALFAWRAHRFQSGGTFSLLSRDAALLCNNVLLAVACAAVLLGTLYPLLLDALQKGKISVGPPYFETTFVPLMTPVVVLMIVGTFLRWKSDAAMRLMRRLWLTACISLAGGIALAAVLDHFTVWTCLGLVLALWVVLGSFQLLYERLCERKEPWMQRLIAIPAAWWGMWLAHLGIGVFIIGVTMINSFQSTIDVKMVPGQKTELAGYTFVFTGARVVPGPNWRANQATIELYDGNKKIAVLLPEKRVYVTQGMPMTQVALDVGLFRDLYVSLGEQTEDGGWIVSIFHKPFVSWIWAGCILMALGGILAAADKRYRRLARRQQAAVGRAAASTAV